MLNDHFWNATFVRSLACISSDAVNRSATWSEILCDPFLVKRARFQSSRWNCPLLDQELLIFSECGKVRTISWLEIIGIHTLAISKPTEASLKISNFRSPTTPTNWTVRPAALTKLVHNEVFPYCCIRLTKQCGTGNRSNKSKRTRTRDNCVMVLSLSLVFNFANSFSGTKILKTAPMSL